MHDLVGNYDLDQLRTHPTETICVVFKQVLRRAGSVQETV